jgi:hypothetical protein
MNGLVEQVNLLHVLGVKGMIGINLLKRLLNKMEDISRKPDFETEHFRMWNDKIENQSQEDKEDYERNIICYKGMKLSLCGFNCARDKLTSEIVFAYKIKNNNTLFYYINENYSKYENKKDELAQTMRFFKVLSEIFTLIMIDMKDVLENLNVQKHILANNLGDKESKNDNKT